MVDTVFVALLNKTATASRQKAAPFGHAYTIGFDGSLNMMLMIRVARPK